MLILGIDPGTATTGFGVLRINKKDFEVVDFGLIETDKNGEPGKRLIEIHKRLTVIIREHSPDVIAIERLFFASNAKTAMRVGQAHGVMIFTAAKEKKQVFEYAPASIKKIITGNGRADKKTMQKKLRKVFGAKVRSRPKQKTHFDNAADALAVALTHALKVTKLK
ncbi:crossover junction endodeoxyribonuclease RuvC [Candidatus Woesebacteria bacterium RBG_16_34_12]|uniref:Crossover junction endodeoxyribonuclease RuvC n=1 Tax=Candidatus Woesebacteria bacterium RBG_16_34_12 TaxID=1802480 RepID=A0A1F7XBN1_9BACT|nr:MAG: crossover junction endodeoxyribonuclease RuvC [Candidatus Woesebacteria bacterium RBG_16_34_12]